MNKFPVSFIFEFELFELLNRNFEFESLIVKFKRRALFNCSQTLIHK